MRSAVVGRERVLGELAGLLDAALTGAGGVALLTGEAGIGKSTVAEALLSRARDAGTPVLVGRAVADEGAPAYWPWRRALGAPAGGLPDRLLDADPPAGGEPGGAAAGRFRVAERVRAALARAAEPAGLVLLLEDVQWADEASAALLRHVCADLAGTRVLVLGTLRTPAAPDRGVDPGDLPGAHVIGLGPFTGADVAASMAELAGGPVSAGWPAQVHRLSGGNPLFVRELTRLLATEGRLAGPATDIPVPAELRRVAMRRMARLEPAARELLDAASVVGEEIDVALLAELAGPDLRPRLPGLLAGAVAAGLLAEDPAAPGRVRFSHELLRRARYDELPRDRRVGWHARVADAVEAAGQAPAVLAHHRVRAAVDAQGHRRAALACRAAADAAGTQLAFADAARWYDQAAALLDGAPDALAERAALLLRAADAAYRDGQYEQALRRCARVTGIAERLGAVDLTVRSAVVVRGVGGIVSEPVIALCTRARALLGEEDSARHALVLAQHAYALAAIDRSAEAEALSARAMPMAERSGDPEALSLALHAWYDVHPGPDAVAERMSAGARLRRLSGGTGRMDAALWSYVWRIEAALNTGATDTVDAEIVEFATLVERLGWPIARWHLLRARTARAMVAGRYAEAEEHRRDALRVARATEDPLAEGLSHIVMAELMMRVGVREREYAAIMAVRRHAITLPIGAVQLGLLCVAAGEMTRAAALLDHARPVLPGYPVNSRWLPTLSMGGQLAAELGDAATATACYRQVLPYQEQYLNSMTSCHGSVARPLGLMAAAGGDLDAAEGHLAVAVERERAVGAPGDAAVAQADRAGVLARRGGPGDRERALEAARAAARVADELGMPPVRQRAGALVERLAGADDPLTAREREIAALVAEGHSNRAIASRLYLSERTVETHVRNLLTKLGLTNRTQVAGWVMRVPRP